MPLEDLHLLQSGVARNLDSFKSIQQRGEYGIQWISSANKKNPGKINLYVHEIIFEFVVLYRIEHLHHTILKTCASRSLHYLIDLIQEYHWILYFRLGNRIPNFTRIRPNICLSMPFNDRGIILSSQRNPCIGPIQTFSYRFHNWSLPNSWWTVQ